MKWIDPNLVLEGEKVILRPMQPHHINDLTVAGADKRIWEFLPVNAEPADIRDHFFLPAFENRDNGTQFPFTIFDKNEKIIGTTRFGEIEPEHRKLEIGWTWYKTEIWGKGYNEECKYLLLAYCFETLGALRVQLKTNEKNVRSRRAIARLGCKFEGIYRNHLIRQGYTRNTAMFSMLPEEWEIAKHKLRATIDSKYAGTNSYEPDAANILFNEYTITTNKALMQPERIHQWLCTKSYWLPNVPFNVVKTAFDSSFCIAVMYDGIQIGYARFITDYAIFAYLADVYIEEEHRGKGLSKKMMETLLSLNWVKRLRKLALGTRDAHGLYAQHGFTAQVHPERYMEMTNSNAW